MQQWKQVETQHRRAGISFLEGMRLLAGAGLTASDQFIAREDTRDWSAVTAGDWLHEVLRELRNPDLIEECDPGRDLKAELRPYQKAGVRWLWFMYRLGLGACLADDMGLGKTIQVLALLLLLEARRTPRAPGPLRPCWSCPASLLGNWKAELERFAPSLRTRFVHPAFLKATHLRTPRPRSRGLSSASGPGADHLRHVEPAGMARAIEWRLAVLDEAQAIKNAGARQTRAVKKLKARAKIALTGTPVENRLADLWSIFDFLNPGPAGLGQGLRRVRQAAWRAAAATSTRRCGAWSARTSCGG